MTALEKICWSTETFSCQLDRTRLRVKRRREGSYLRRSNLTGKTPSELKNRLPLQLNHCALCQGALALAADPPAGLTFHQ